MDRLLADLSTHALDLVLTDAPLPATSGVRAHSRRLGHSGLSFFASPRLAAHLRGPFPECLEGQPMVVPVETAALRRPLEAWLGAKGVSPRVMAEVDDSALTKIFGKAGVGVFVAPTVTEAEVCRQYNVVCIGQVDALKEEFYAISMERRIHHPAVLAILKEASRFFEGGTNL